ncbi:MAG: hypothetical protein ACLFWH_09950 [Actinomycetota bacterium]
MSAKKWRTAQQADDTQQSVSRGWHLVQNYPREDPERHLNEIDLTEAENDSAKPFEVPSLLLSAMRTFQEEVVGWLEFAMLAWFNFYFAIGDGSPDDRLEEAAERLLKASERLRPIARRMGTLPWRETHWYDLVMVYSEAVEYWAEAVGLIGRGAKLDHHYLAEAGFGNLNLGSSSAERVVAMHSSPERGVDLDEAIRKLEKLDPPAKVSKKKVEESKQPWRRALTAAASPMDWSKSPW